MSTSQSSSSVGKWADGVKVTVYLKKKDGISDEQFSHYYAYVHAALTGPILLRHGCISYTQLHCMADTATPNIARLFGPDVLSAQNPVQIMPYDACSSFVFANLQDAQNFFSDPETTSVLAADSLQFTNPATLQVTVGHEFIVIRNGQAQHRQEA